MNNRIGLAVAGVIAAIAIILVIIQSGNLSQAQGTITSIQSTATAQQSAFVGQGTAAVATLSAASTQAADSANTAATAQAKSLSDAANAAATSQAKALADAAKAASTMQAQALAAASQAAATAEAKALADAANKAATAQASAVTNAQNAASTQRAQAEATLETRATATLGAVVNAAQSAQADAVKAAQEAAATKQAQAIQTVQAQATATLGAVVGSAATNVAQIQAEYQATQKVADTQIANAQAQVATAQANATANAAQPTAANEQATAVVPTAEATSEANAIPKDWKRYVGKGVAIQLPNTYVGSELGSDPAALSKMLRALGPDFESAAALLEQNPDILAFIAVDIGSKTGNPSSVIVVSIPMPVKFSLNTLLEATVNQLPGGSKVIEKGIVQLGEYEAGRMIVETHVGSIVSTQLQYYIIQNNTLYLVGFTGAPGNFDGQLPGFEQSMKTFEILAKPGI